MVQYGRVQTEISNQCPTYISEVCITYYYSGKLLFVSGPLGVRMSHAGLDRFRFLYTNLMMYPQSEMPLDPYFQPSCT